MRERARSRLSSRRLDRISQPLRSICALLCSRAGWRQRERERAFYLIAISTFDEPDVPIYDEVSSAHLLCI
jgi:hypothetical protein